MGRYVFIVARDQPDLWAHLAREFSGEQEVDVLIDRRQLNRRNRAELATPDRRRTDRRLRRAVQQALASMSFALVPTD